MDLFQEKTPKPSANPVLTSQEKFFLKYFDIFSSVLPSNENRILGKKSYFTSLRSRWTSSHPNEPTPSLDYPFIRFTESSLGLREKSDVRMKDYQLEGLGFLRFMAANSVPAILGDEMGLGKTLQTIALLSSGQWLSIYVTPLKNTDIEWIVYPPLDLGPREASQRDTVMEKLYGTHPTLIICPLSVLNSWKTEFLKFCPHLSPFVAVHHSDKSMLRSLSSQIQKKDIKVVVTSYERYVSNSTWFKSLAWGIVVLDEGQRIKNFKSNLSKEIGGLGRDRSWKLILTGTPLQNNLIEFWSFLHYLYPKVYTLSSFEIFQRSFDLSRGNVSKNFLEHCKKLLEIIMLRRTKQGLGDGVFKLPEKKEIVIGVPLSPYQKFWYLRLIRRTNKIALDEIFSSDDSNKVKKEEQFSKLGEIVSEKLRLEDKAPVNSSLAPRKSDIIGDLRNLTETVIEDSHEEGGTKWKKLMNLLMQLRKVCNHPYDFELELIKYDAE
jgi:SWI/SNF-related matrix-associated actin-dependent regulator of chromatin subfamily A member 5